MINNRLVNFWRGDREPPTIYHVWIKDNSKMLLYNGTSWVVFLDNKEILDKVESFITATINGKPIINNPTLSSSDIKLGESGTYVNSTDTITLSTLELDLLLTTQKI